MSNSDVTLVIVTSERVVFYNMLTFDHQFDPHQYYNDEDEKIKP